MSIENYTVEAEAADDGSVDTTAATSLVLASNMGATNETITLKSFDAILYYR